MKGKKLWSALAAAALSINLLPSASVWAKTESADDLIVLDPTDVSLFNDTDGDGLGEFEGWGSSLCWWANRIGSDQELTEEAVRLFYTDEGLNLNIGRYNAGGGDLTASEEQMTVPVNPAADIYDPQMASYSGSKMEVSTLTSLASARYTRSDADFGLTKGRAVGNLSVLGWINALGADPGNGSNLTFTVNTEDAGDYTLKFMLELSGTNSRGVAVDVNGNNQYEISSDIVNASVIASSGNVNLYVPVMENVHLDAGANTLTVGGNNNDWMADFIAMAVIPSGQEGVVDEDEFLHEEHIIRSDSGIPSYIDEAVEMDLDAHDLAWYEEHYDRADAASGFAWNYDWNADAAQINVVKEIQKQSGDDFIAEIFSNSPPYFMTVSGCTSGHTNASTDNLKSDCYEAFAKYLADVIGYWKDNGIEFQSVEPVNEPNTDYWSAYSTKQEGCHFDPASIAKIINALNAELEEKDIDILIATSDETSIDKQISDWNGLDDQARAAVDRIDTHTYGGSQRSQLQQLALDSGKNLWMSEVDGSYTAGIDAGQMSAGLGLARQIILDLNNLKSSAWVLWNLIDVHVDSSDYGKSWIEKGSGIDFEDEEALYAKWKANTSSGYWGVAAANHDTHSVILSKKYYAFGQFTRYITPGMTLIGSSDSSLAAYDPDTNQAVIVVMNTDADDKRVCFDLSGFNAMGSRITAIRTSGDLETGENWADVTASDNIAVNLDTQRFMADVKANSITTYIIEDVEYDAKSAPDTSLTRIAVTAEQVTGSDPWNNSSNDCTKVIDGDFSTFFDGVSEGWVQYDLLEDTLIEAIGYAPRSGYASRCKDALIYGSKDGETWDLLYQVPSNPSENTMTVVDSILFEPEREDNVYRYIKYTVPSGSSYNCNLSELAVYGHKYDPISEGLAAYYDMSVSNGSLKDLSGNGNDAVLVDLDEESVASYEGTSVLQFASDGYAEIPAGLLSDENFTIQAVVSKQGTANDWLWTLGNRVDSWPNVTNYLFVGPSSAQSGYSGKVLAALADTSSEVRMPAPENTTPAGFVTITLVSEGQQLRLYMDGTLVSTLNHDKDTASIFPTEGCLGYIGKSLYAPDPLLEANVSEMKIWDRVLDADEIEQEAASEEEKKQMVVADIAKDLLKENKDISSIESNVHFASSMDGFDLSWNIDECDSLDASGSVTIPQGADVTVNAEVSWNQNGTQQSHVFELVIKGKNTEGFLEDAIAFVSIPNANDVRDNLYLPESYGNVVISWSCDHPEIIECTSSETVAAGVVTRPETDTEVVLKAVYSLDGQSREVEYKLLVKAAPEEITSSDLTDYFFAYFAGEGYSDGEQIYFAASQDGLNWQDLNNNNPILTSSLGEKGVRDPYILRAACQDKFYLIATDLKINGGNGWDAAQTNGSQSLMVWESTDLVHWSDERMVEVSASIEAGCTWAPEAIYDPASKQYVVYWSSKTAEDGYSKQRVYYCTTRDFYTFSEPEVFIDYDQSSIDTTIIESDGSYYRFTKNEGSSTNELGALTKTIFLEKANSVTGSYTHIVSDSLNANQWVEGPAIFKLNEDDSETDTWCLLVDDFGGIGYYPLLCTDLDSGEFIALESGTYQMPSRARHGTPIPVTSQEYQGLIEAYGSAETVITASLMGTLPELPETVLVGHEQKAVTWNLDGVNLNVQPFEYVTITGTVDGTNLLASASVQMVPADLEYMVDCANSTSLSWNHARELSDLLLNEVCDKQKAEGDTWGAVSIIGPSSQADSQIVPYSAISTTDPYAGGYWARSNEDIIYSFDLPAGVHTVYAGCKGWWSMGRQMDVYATIDGVSTKIFDLDAVKSSNVAASGTITLNSAQSVTITVKKADSNDPILSWLAISLDEAYDSTADELKALIKEMEGVDTSLYTTTSREVFEKALNAAKETAAKKDVTEEEVNEAADALQAAYKALVLKADKAQLKALEQGVQEAGELKETISQARYEQWASVIDAAAQALEDPEDLPKEQADVLIENLNEALESMRLNTVMLERVIARVEGANPEDYLSPEAFVEALENAKAVAVLPHSEQEIADALWNLNTEWMNLRRKPDQAVVDDLALFLQEAYGSLDLLEGEERKEVEQLCAEIEAALKDENLDESTANALQARAASARVLIENAKNNQTTPDEEDGDQEEDKEDKDDSDVIEKEPDPGSDTFPAGPGGVVRDDITVKRLYNPNTSEHFYTTSQHETDVLVAAGWKQEFCGWKAGWDEKTGVAVYRLYNANAGDHHYTTDVHERNVLVSLGWKDEGVAFYMCKEDTNHCSTVHRLYNPNAKAGSHHYTTDKLEIAVLVEAGWIDEGKAWCTQ